MRAPPTAPGPLAASSVAGREELQPIVTTLNTPTRNQVRWIMAVLLLITRPETAADTKIGAILSQVESTAPDSRAGDEVPVSRQAPGRPGTLCSVHARPGSSPWRVKTARQ